MKLGVLYIVCSGVVLAAVAVLIALLLIPTDGTQPSLIGSISRVVVGLAIGLWLLPKGVSRIKIARDRREVK